MSDVDLTKLSDQQLLARMIEQQEESKALLDEMQRRCPDMPLWELFAGLSPQVEGKVREMIEKPPEPKAH